MSNKSQMKTFLKSWTDVKTRVQNFIDDNNLKELQTTAKKYIKSRKKDVNKLLTHKDFVTIKKRFYQEKRQVEKLVNRLVGAELKKAKKFVQDHKKEIDKLQKKVETYVPATKKVTKAVKKVAGKKKTAAKPKKTTRTAAAKKKKTTKKKATTKKKTAKKKVVKKK